jgi:hypothetical protein
MHDSTKKFIQQLSQKNLKGRHHPQDLDVDQRIILKLTLRKQAVNL